MSEPVALSFSKKLRYGGEVRVVLSVHGVLPADRHRRGLRPRRLHWPAHLLSPWPAGRAKRNLRAAYPDDAEDEIDEIVREMCDNLGRVVAEYPHLGKLTLGGPGARIQIDGIENAEAAFAKGKGVMFISGHFANWETMPVAAGLLGYEGGLVYRPPNNPTVDRWISRQRANLDPRNRSARAHGERGASSRCCATATRS